MSGLIDTNTTNVIDVYDALTAYEKAVRGRNEAELDRTRSVLGELLKRSAVAPQKGCPCAASGELFCEAYLKAELDNADG